MRSTGNQAKETGPDRVITESHGGEKLTEVAE